MRKAPQMDAQEFREFGYAAIDFVAEYLESLRERWVLKRVSSVSEKQLKQKKEERWMTTVNTTHTHTHKIWLKTCEIVINGV